MNPAEVIEATRDRRELTAEEIREWIGAYVRGDIADYQMSAWLMAVYLNGLTDGETLALTDAMARSGETVDLSSLGAATADKHSTGGVGDKTSLVAGPMAAAVGVRIAKMSGRGLAHTGGTIDKLEAIHGLRTALDPKQVLALAERVGLVIGAQTGDLAPADKLLYALRDVTGTVGSLPLIASSIMSKKIAAGARCIVLDVKVGSGAFMKTLEEAQRLAAAMVGIGTRLGRSVTAYITDMNRPLGRAVGNALEVREAVETLLGRGPEDLAEVSLTLAAEMASLALGLTREEARFRVAEAWRRGGALSVFQSMVREQGGTWHVGAEYPAMDLASLEIAVRSGESGRVAAVDALEIGKATASLGAGRTRKDAPVDHGVGILLKKGVGDPVAAGDALAVLVVRREPSDDIVSKVRDAFSITRGDAEDAALVYARVDSAGVVRF